MRSNLLCVGVCMAMLLGSSLALADQKVKTKSNIKNDRLAEASSSASCLDESAKESSADGQSECKTVITKSSASSVASKEVEVAKP